MGNFAASILRFTTKAKADIDTVVQKATAEIAKRVIERSPVESGLFRGNWVFGVGQIDHTTTEETDKTGQKALSRIIAEIGKTKAGGVTYISNSLPYALTLEYGNSKRHPVGMARLTAVEFKQIVRQAVSEAKK